MYETKPGRRLQSCINCGNRKDKRKAVEDPNDPYRAILLASDGTPIKLDKCDAVFIEQFSWSMHDGRLRSTYPKTKTNIFLPEFLIEHILSRNAPFVIIDQDQPYNLTRENLRVDGMSLNRLVPIPGAPIVEAEVLVETSTIEPLLICVPLETEKDGPIVIRAATDGLYVNFLYPFDQPRYEREVSIGPFRTYEAANFCRHSIICKRDKIALYSVLPIGYDKFGLSPDQRGDTERFITEAGRAIHKKYQSDQECGAEIVRLRWVAQQCNCRDADCRKQHQCVDCKRWLTRRHYINSHSVCGMCFFQQWPVNCTNDKCNSPTCVKRHYCLHCHSYLAIDKFYKYSSNGYRSMRCTSAVNCHVKRGSEKDPDNPDPNAWRIEIVYQSRHMGWILVDEEDALIMGLYNWSYRNGYAIRRDAQSGKLIRMHRAIMNVTGNSTTIVDHIDGNTFNNRRNNLRLTNLTGNALNIHTASRNGIVGWRGPAAFHEGYYLCTMQFTLSDKTHHSVRQRVPSNVAGAYLYRHLTLQRSSEYHPRNAITEERAAQYLSSEEMENLRQLAIQMMAPYIDRLLTLDLDEEDGDDFDEVLDEE